MAFLRHPCPGPSLVLCILVSTPAAAQTFIRVTAAPVATDIRRSGGCAWADVNGDGHLDLFTGNGNTTAQNNSLYLSDRMGGFIAVTEGPVVTDGGSSIGGTWGDYDNDGDPDLFVTNRTSSLNFLYRNDAGTLVRILDGPVGTDMDDSNMSTWVDVDGDGDLDLFVLNFNSVNFLYLNDGTGGFTRRTGGVEAATATLSIACAWGDYNNDGAPDLFVANGGAQNNDLYTNDGAGNFTRSSFADGHSSLGGSWGDYDNDGDRDLFVADFLDENNLLYRNEGAPGYALVSVSATPVTSDGGRSLGSAWGDVDNDGDLDLYVGNDGGINFLYRNEGGGSFVRVFSGDIVTGVGNTFGVVLTDYDNDGDLDAMEAVRTDAVNVLWRNEGTDNAWLRVGFKGTASNRSAIGTRVVASAVISGMRVRQTREIASQDGYNSQSGLLALFGLGDATVVDTLTVRWPSGQVDEHLALPVRRNLIVTEGEAEVVPVRLVSFTGQRSPDGIHLRWRVADASGTLRYHVFRGPETESGEPIGSVEATYENGDGDFLDAYPPAETARYELRALGRDGITRRLGTVSVPAGAVPVLATLGPNPFAGRITLVLRLPDSGPVRVTVHDMRGALVRVLHEGEMPAGTGEVGWDGTDTAGRSVSDGIYLVRVVGPSLDVSRRVVRCAACGSP